MNTNLQMKPHDTKGILITFCGLDGCGKTTMIQWLREALEQEGFDAALTKQPTNHMRQSHIFRTYMDQEDHSGYSYRSLSLMAAADRIQHCNHTILPVLNKGTVLISDRYFYSCLANLRARGFQEDRWVYEIAKNEIPKPDLAFFLDTEVETAMIRVRQRPEERDRYVDTELQYRLRDEYLKICADNNGILVSTDQDPTETFAEILYHVKRVMEDKKNGK